MTTNEAAASLASAPSSARVGRSSRRLVASTVSIAMVVVAVAIALGLFDGAARSLVVPDSMWNATRQVLAGSVALIVLGWFFTMQHHEGYLAALWVTSARLPGIIAAAWLLAYLTPPAVGMATTASLGVGLWCAVAAWLLLAVPFRRVAMPATAQSQAYGEILNRFHQLRARCEACSHAAAGVERSAAERSAQAEAIRHLATISRMFDLDGDGVPPTRARRGSLGWASGTSYVTAWEALNRADEALLEIEPNESIIGEALHDMLRLSGSSIRNAGYLQTALRAAVRHLDPQADRDYFVPQLGRPDERPARHDDVRRPEAPLDGQAATTRPTTATTQATTATAATARVVPLDDDAIARAVIREVRHAVNDYRDVRRAGLIRAHNRLLRTILVTGISADILLGLVIVEGVKPSTLGTAAALFLVGGVVGLFNRLRIEGGSGAATAPDYGLFDARLLHTLLISGLAGVGGVFLMSAAPIAGAAFGAGGQAVTPLSIDQVFDVGSNRLAIIVAAVFGLTPDLIIGRLRQQVDALKEDLSTSEAATQREPAAVSQ